MFVVTAELASVCQTCPLLTGARDPRMGQRAAIAEILASRTCVDLAELLSCPIPRQHNQRHASQAATQRRTFVARDLVPRLPATGNQGARSIYGAGDHGRGGNPIRALFRRNRARREIFRNRVQANRAGRGQLFARPPTKHEQTALFEVAA
jgi:hypothetical protein